MLVALTVFSATVWADSRNFTYFNQGDNTKSPVTVNCGAVYNEYAVLRYGGKNLTISVSAGYSITSIRFVVAKAVDRVTISTTKGTLSNNRPQADASAYVNDVNSASVTLSTEGEYRIERIEVNYKVEEPTGSVDGLTGKNGSFRVWGWAYDPDAEDSYAVTIHVYLFDNDTEIDLNKAKKGIIAGTANIQRDDLASMGHGVMHGFDFNIGITDLNPGTYYVRVFALDKQGISNPNLGYSDASGKVKAVTISAPYTVSYNANGGSGAPGSQKKAQDITLKLSTTTPTRTGYTFNGWNTNNSGTGTNYAAGANYTANANATLYAKWTIVNYTIGYTLNGGSVSGNPTSYNVETNTFTLKNPTRTGYTFQGWTGSNGSTAQTSVSIAKGSTGNKSYTANWAAATYTVTLNQQGGTGGSGSVTATYDAAMPKITVPTRTGYTFQGYYTEANGNGTQYYNANGNSAKNWDKSANTTLYAHWTVNTYTVTLDMQSGTGGSTSVTATYNADMPAITLPTRDGYFFEGYSDSEGKLYYTATGESARKYDRDAAITLYAQWKDKSIPVPQPSGEWEAYMPAGNRMLRVTYKDEPKLAWVDKDKQPVTAISGYHGFQSLVAIPNINASNKFLEAVMAGTSVLEAFSSNQEVVKVIGIDNFLINGVGEADLAVIHRNDADFKYDSAAFHVTVLAPDTVTLKTNNAEWGTVAAITPLCDSIHADENNKFYAVPEAVMSVKATPAEGFHLRYWSNGTAVNADLDNTFAVQGNLDLLAFFAPDTVPAKEIKAPQIYDTLVYNSEAQTILVNGEAEGGQFKYSLDSAVWSTELPKIKDAGTHTFYYYIDSTDVLHRALPVQTRVVTIAKAQLKITAENKETVYGYAAPGFSVSYYGLQGNDLPADVLTGELSYACEYTVGSNAGEYDITPGGQTALNYDITYYKGKLVVYKADPAFTEPVANTLTYNGGAQTLVAAGITEHGTFEYTFTPNDEESWNTALPQAKDAGEYGVYYRIVGDRNHNDYESADAVVVTIAKAALTATADNKTVIYGDAVPTYTVTYEGWQGEDDATVLTGTIAYACEYAPTSIVGEYTITPSGVSNPNYAITFINGKVTVNKAALTITADNKEVIYGDEAPLYTAVFEGWKNEEDESDLDELDYICTYEQGSPVGTYTIAPTAADHNYDITITDATLTVNQATVFVSDADIQEAKFVDGNTDAVVLNAGVLNGIKLSDPIGHVTTASFSDAAVGEGKTITMYYELTGDAALLANYNLTPTSEIFAKKGIIIEKFIPDDNPDKEDQEAEVKEGIEVYAYGYCDDSGYSLRYHLNSGKPDQYKIDFSDSRFTDVDWKFLTTPGPDGTIDINIPVDMPTGDYTFTATFRDSRFTWLESKPFTVTFHVNLPDTYVAPLFDNTIALVDTCNCFTDIQWYHRDNDKSPWKPIEGATGHYYRPADGAKLTGEYFVKAKWNGEPTFTCGQADMETLYGASKKKTAQVRAYPNPVVNSTVVAIDNSDEWNHNLRIVNLMGVEMLNTTFEGNTTTVDMTGYIQGNYMISVDGIVVKVMKQ
jgi:uncharacterized repeat protein (TIGR02543 family)